MVLSTFEEGFAEEIKTDLRNKNDLVGLLLSTENSRLTAQQLAAGKASLISTLRYEHISTANTGDLVGADGYLSTVATQASQSLSAEYPLPVGSQIQGSADRLAIGTVKIPYAYRDFHSSGDGLPRFLEEGLKQQIRDQIESFCFVEMWTDGAGNVADAGFALDTSSEAALIDDYKDLANFAELRNWHEPRIIAARPVDLKHAALGFSDFTSVDFNQALDPVSGGGLMKYAGFNHVYSNNATASQAVAFIPSAFALVVREVQVEVLKDKDERADFMRVWVNFGAFATRQTTTNNDGSGTGNPVEGLAKIVIS